MCKHDGGQKELGLHIEIPLICNNIYVRCPQDEGYEEFRALFTGLLDSDPAAPSSELSKRMQEIAQPLVVKLGDAAAKLIQ